MDSDSYRQFKRMLNERREHLLHQGNETVSHEATHVREHLVEYADIATLESERNFRMRIRGRERKLIKKIDQALERLEDGTFGLCERCGEEISLKRLSARPVTTYCINCKTKLEEEEID
ncbi:RNA polymerase-binding protein DksA [candidate division KSB3 bacterium]|uniref:RNA polymerase-binding protein DksA n=1 Tax=candidate division KSB3 bacterium TaxID=2044937 RepID=A0A2G6EA49_9BACT|nr:MAG: RNA polymerase-binding protein DksA [candidate division KSB3 bacterium]PIE30898.1 MAG: RNA polymerase-binding protein DksA [candidate division KSB3 bacterium]